jgi:hypothetical protein
MRVLITRVHHCEANVVSICIHTSYVEDNAPPRRARCEVQKLADNSGHVASAPSMPQRRESTLLLPFFFLVLDLVYRCFNISIKESDELRTSQHDKNLCLSHRIIGANELLRDMHQGDSGHGGASRGCHGSTTSCLCGEDDSNYHVKNNG